MQDSPRDAATILLIFGAVVLMCATSLIFVAVAMRTKSPRLLDAVRRFNRAFTNKLQLRSAGGPGAYE
ncbi:MAG: hypothetical protein ACT4PI_03390 [Actinomycetota bacterium]